MPGTLVRTSIRKPHLSLSLPFVLSKVSGVRPSIRKGEKPFPVHTALRPEPVICIPTRPSDCAVSVHLVLEERAGVDRLIGPDVSPATFLQTRFVVSSEFAAVRPCLTAMPMLLVINPVPDIYSPNRTFKGPMPLRLALRPAPLIPRPIKIDMAPLSIWLVVFPIPDILLPIRVHEHATAMLSPLSIQLPTIQPTIRLHVDKSLLKSLIVANAPLKGPQTLLNKLHELLRRH
jgi:hypothetical protein